ncbi:MAG: MFS transporter [Candidatus Neomarinimicrobiota bacterium]
MQQQNRNISLLWAAQVVSSAGDAIYQIALLWLVLDVTGSSTITGLIAMAAFLPAMLFGLYAGVIVDKYNRKLIMILSNLSQALTVIVIPILLYFGYKNMLLIGFFAFVRASFSTFFPPALNALVPMITSKSRLVRVNSILATSSQLAYLIGPLVAGLILSIVSIPYLFVIDSFSFIIAILILLFVTVPTKTKKVDKQFSSVKELFSGIQYAAKHKPFKILFILTIINNFFIMGPAFVGMLILVKNALGGTASQYAFVEAGLAFGMLLGSAFVYRLGNRINIGKLLLIGMIIDGVTYSVMYFAGSVNYVLLFIVIHAFGIPMITISRTAIIQKHSPNEYHGRLFSLVHLSVIGVTAVSSAVVGIAANYIDIKIIFLFIGIGAALCGVAGFMNKNLREID